MSDDKAAETGYALQDNALKYLVFLSLFLSLGSYFIRDKAYDAETIAYLLVTLVGLIIGAASLFFIVFAFSIYQETRQFEKLRKEMETTLHRIEESNLDTYEATVREAQELVLSELLNAQETDRRRWKMVSINIIQIIADILHSINDAEDRESIEEELRRLEPLRYLLESVAEENVVDTINALNECVTLAEKPDMSLSDDMLAVLLEAIDAQRQFAKDNPDVVNPQALLDRLDEIEERATQKVIAEDI